MNRLQKKFVADALEKARLLTEYEINFLRDLSERLDDYVLTDRENKLLNQIQRRVS